MDEYTLQRYFPKSFRTMIYDIQSPVHRDYFLNYEFEGGHHLRALEWTAQIVFEARPHTAFYIFPLMEYTVRLYTENDDIPLDRFLNYAVDIVYRRSSFNPIHRFNPVISLILFYLGLL